MINHKSMCARRATFHHKLSGKKHPIKKDEFGGEKYNLLIAIRAEIIKIGIGTFCRVFPFLWTAVFFALASTMPLKVHFTISRTPPRVKMLISVGKFMSEITSEYCRFPT